MKKYKELIMLVFALVIVSTFAGCSNESNQDQDFTSITVSTSDVNVFNGQEITITARINSGEVNKVTFYFDGTEIGSSIYAPYVKEYILQDVTPGTHKVTCIAETKWGNQIQDETNVSLTLRLGDEYQGGKIFYLEENGKNGLIASKEDLSYNSDQGTEFRFYWGVPGELLGTSLDNGKENTAIMASKATSPGCAAYHFKNGYEYNGYNDWYIPSYNELELLKENKSYIGNFSNSTDWNAMYWSSSEQSETKAFILNFNALMGNTNNKERVFKIRPIRQF